MHISICVYNRCIYLYIYISTYVYVYMYLCIYVLTYICIYILYVYVIVFRYCIPHNIREYPSENEVIETMRMVMLLITRIIRG